MPDASTLTVKDLTVRYGRRRSLMDALARRGSSQHTAVDGVSLTVEGGESVAVVGESGCGKTSLVEAMLMLRPPESGSVDFKGRSLTEVSKRQLRALRRDIQFVPQDPYESLGERATVESIVAEPLKIHRIGGSMVDHAAIVRSALARVGLDPPGQFMNRYPHELSGGQRQRVAIATALVLGPSFLIADEPVSMLDVSLRAGVLELLVKLRDEDDMGIVMITHDLSTAVHFADRVAVMYLGRIVEEGPAARVIRNPKHPYTRALAEAVPRIARHGVRPETPIVDAELTTGGEIPAGCRFNPRCWLAEDRCRASDPMLDAFVDGEQRAACLLVPKLMASEEKVESKR